MENLGVKVVLLRRYDDKNLFEVYRNITEIHFHYNNGKSYNENKMIAFESNIHGTGCTEYIDNVIEFVTSPETVKQLVCFQISEFTTKDRVFQ